MSKTNMHIIQYTMHEILMNAYKNVFDWKLELKNCHKLKFSNPYIFAT